MWNFVCYSTWARAPGTAFWLVHNWPLGLRGIYITLGYTFFSSIENFSAYCPVLRCSILLPPRHPSVFARMARWQLRQISAWRRKSFINYINAGAHQMEPPSPLISWVNPFPSRFINTTACFPRKVSYFRESRMSPWKKWSWMKSNSEARPSTVFLFYYTFIFTILQPLGSGYHEIKVNELPADWAWSGWDRRYKT